jgi:hypothetical protein
MKMALWGGQHIPDRAEPGLDLLGSVALRRHPQGVSNGSAKQAALKSIQQLDHHRDQDAAGTKSHRRQK